MDAIACFLQVIPVTSKVSTNIGYRPKFAGILNRIPLATDINGKTGNKSKKMTHAINSVTNKHTTIMKKALLFLVLSVFFAEMTLCQEKLKVEGAIILGNSEDETPMPGTIRWTGTDFQGWNGS
jgi:hypothetical protein